MVELGHFRSATYLGVRCAIRQIPLASGAVLGHYGAAGVRQKGLDNMKQISTGAGLVALSLGMVATAFIATHRGSGEAFAQGTGGDRRIVSAGVYIAGSEHWGYRIWSDNTTEVKFLAATQPNQYIGGNSTGGAEYLRAVGPQWGTSSYRGAWQVVDSGTSAFLQADVDHSTQVDGGDISAVLLEFGGRNDETPPPPIDCTIGQVK